MPRSYRPHSRSETPASLSCPARGSSPCGCRTALGKRSRPHTGTWRREWAPLSSNSMPIEWAGLTPGLLLALDPRRGVPLRSQLEGELRQAIRSGRLTVGERLPSSRALAHQLGVSRGLVQECYGQLQAEGYLTTRVGSATRVAAGGQVATAPLAPSTSP